MSSRSLVGAIGSLDTIASLQHDTKVRMYTLEKIKKEIVDAVNKAVGKKVATEADLVYPPKPDFGDLSLPTFNQSKLGMNGNDLFAKLSKQPNKKWSLNQAGAYLNFKLNKNFLAENVLKEIAKLKGKYGANDGGRKKKVMIEYSNGNTHKEVHVGHLRNITYGDAVNKLLAANGYKSIPVSYINDFGIHVAKTLWAYTQFYANEPVPADKGYFLGQVYVRAGSEEAKDKTAKDMILFMMRKIEMKRGNEYKLWQKTRQWSIDALDKIYYELEIKFAHTFYESEYIDKGKDLVARLYREEVLEKSDGAIIANLDKDDLGVLVIIRSDGTALYPVADLALAVDKFKKYKPDRSLHVVDIRQSLYFKQLFRLLAMLGYKQPMVHLPYDFVKLPSGMMKSRTGNVVTYQDLRDQLYAKAVAETKKRHPDWPANKYESVAEKIIIGAMKFEMLKVGANQVITFDLDKALQFDGFTAAYLQYTCARINSILKKSKVKSQKSKVMYNNLNNPKEQEVIIKLSKYPEVVRKAGGKYDPSEIAKFIYALAQDFNDYYHAVPVLKAEKEISRARIALIAAVREVIANGLALLGITVIDEM